MKRTLWLPCAFSCVAGAMVASASPPNGVTPTPIGRGTYEPFRVESDELEFESKAKREVDLVVRTHDYAPGSSTGWHMHPGPVFITVLTGEVTFYEADDPTCTGRTVSEGEGYVDTGHGHIGRNETGSPAKDVTVIVAPVGQPFRSELPEPGAYCGF